MIECPIPPLSSDQIYTGQAVVPVRLRPSRTQSLVEGQTYHVTDVVDSGELIRVDGCYTAFYSWRFVDATAFMAWQRCKVSLPKNAAELAEIQKSARREGAEAAIAWLHDNAESRRSMFPSNSTQWSYLDKIANALDAWCSLCIQAVMANFDGPAPLEMTDTQPSINMEWWT